MPNHEKHRETSIQWFSVASSLIAICTVLFFQSVYAILIIPTLMLISYPSVRAGAMFPDIDIASSKPYSALMFSMPVFGVVVATSIYLKRSNLSYRSIPKIIVVAVIGLIVGRILRGVLRSLLSKLKHRGPTHRASVGGLVGLGLAAVVHNLLRDTALHSFRIIISPLVAVSFFIGHLSHLFLDQSTAKDGYRMKF